MRRHNGGGHVVGLVAAPQRVKMNEPRAKIRNTASRLFDRKCADDVPATKRAADKLPGRICPRCVW